MSFRVIICTHSNHEEPWVGGGNPPLFHAFLESYCSLENPFKKGSPAPALAHYTLSHRNYNCIRHFTLSMKHTLRETQLTPDQPLVAGTRRIWLQRGGQGRPESPRHQQPYTQLQRQSAPTRIRPSCRAQGLQSNSEMLPTTRSGSDQPERRRLRSTWLSVRLR